MATNLGNGKELGAERRSPMRKRGRERLHLLLDATADLLAERLDEDISLAQIAERADVPLASVYHFFPNRGAAFVALAQRYHAEIAARAMAPVHPPPPTWQHYIANSQKAGAAHLNRNPAALRLFMGAGVSVEVRNTDLSGNAALAKQRTAYLRATFDMPKVPDLEKWVAVSIALVDGVWALSYSLHRSITPEYLEESTRCSIAYLRCYLPEVVERREP
nr:TetR/AcrR family transcriptional regulator [Bradyrhizobium cosmicum]